MFPHLKKRHGATRRGFKSHSLRQMCHVRALGEQSAAFPEPFVEPLASSRFGRAFARRASLDS